MSIAEIKGEAIRQFAIKVESMEDRASLQMVLDFLEGIGGDDKNAMNLSQHYESIKMKYGSVLNRLAQ